MINGEEVDIEQNWALQPGRETPAKSVIVAVAAHRTLPLVKKEIALAFESNQVHNDDHVSRSTAPLVKIDRSYPNVVANEGYAAHASSENIRTHIHELIPLVGCDDTGTARRLAVGVNTAVAPELVIGTPLKKRGFRPDVSARKMEKEIITGVVDEELVVKYVLYEDKVDEILDAGVATLKVRDNGAQNERVHLKHWCRTAAIVAADLLMRYIDLCISDGTKRWEENPNEVAKRDVAQRVGPNVATKKAWNEAEKERASCKAMIKEVDALNKPPKVDHAIELKALLNEDIDCIANEPMKSDNIEHKLSDAGIQIKVKHSPFMVITETEVAPMIEVENKGEVKPFKAKENSPAGLEDKKEDWKLVVYPKEGWKKATEKLLRTPPAWNKADQMNVATKKGWDEAKTERESSMAMKIEVVYKPSRVARALEPKALVNKDIENEPMKSANVKRLVQAKAKTEYQEMEDARAGQMMKEWNTSKAHVTCHSAYLISNGWKYHLYALINKFICWASARTSKFVLGTTECNSDRFTCHYVSATRNTTTHVLFSNSHNLPPHAMPVKFQRTRFFKGSSTAMILAAVFLLFITSGSHAQEVSLKIFFFFFCHYQFISTGILTTLPLPLQPLNQQLQYLL